MGRARLSFIPLLVIMNVGKKLAKESRVAYAKLENVEQAHTVRFVGTADPQYLDIMDGVVDKCWARRSENEVLKHHRKQHGKN